MKHPTFDELRSLPLWHDYRPTSLIDLPGMAERAQVERVLVKAENERPLGNFKVLGGMLAGLRALARAVGATSLHDVARSLSGPLPSLLCASDGNHGLAVAAAARAAGTSASIYLPKGISPARSARIRVMGAEIIWIEGTYDDAVDRAAEAARRGDGLLVPDTTSHAFDPVVRDVMAGYALLSQELVQQFNALAQRPSHMFVQAGVGGLAASLAKGLHAHMDDPRHVAVVEPETAACVARALSAGRPVRLDGDLKTAAEMLSCGLACAPALRLLLRYKATSVLVDEPSLQAAVATLAALGGPISTPSGAAGLAGLLAVARDPKRREMHALDKQSVVLLVVTEGGDVSDSPRAEERSNSE